ncbi:PD-(D/E)XK nuclease-like domain-containing protein [Serratia aquatilis]|uniref:PD-(D/E)XK nuclease-like domain-containing protein n=1 Tax=Serratia aquatilis TaxID=1737515 RepID=A0ABV6E9P7_9GAMM
MQNTAAYLLRAKQKSGKPHLYVHFIVEDGDDAETTLSYLFMKAKYVKNDYFAAVRINFHVVDGLPPDGEFSETFWLSWALDGDSGKTCLPRDTLDPSLAFPKLYPYMLKTDADKPSKTPEPPAKDEAKYLATDINKHTMIAAAWLYGSDCLKLNDEQLNAATKLLMDDAQRYPQNVIMALSSLREFDPLYPEVPISVIAGMKAIWPPFGKAPELGKLSQFATEYLHTKLDDRQSVISKWQTGSSAAVSQKKEELPRTSSGAIAGTGKKPVNGTPMASFGELESVIYLAHYPSDFDIANPPSAIVNAIKEMKARKEKAPIAWYEPLKETPGVLNFSREAVGVLIRNAPENIHLTPGALRTYINKNLIEIDGKTGKEPPHVQTESLQQSEAILLADEQSSNEALADTATGAGSASLAGEPINQNASFESEKEEVGAAEDLEPATRYAWLRREIMTALDGKTSVMSAVDVEELIVKTGDLNHAYLARLLAKEIEPCDPFKQLAADEVHHLACDVLEDWADDKEERCKFINERVEYYLSEKLQENSTAPDEGPGLKKVGKGLYDVSTLFAESPLAGVVVNSAAAANDVREFLETPATEPVQNDEPTMAADTQPGEPEITDEPPYFEPGRYTNIQNDVYHAANGISSTMLKDARVSLMYFNARHVAKTIKKVHSKVLDLGNLVHTMALEPEKLEQEFSIEPIIPKGAFTTTASMREFIDKHNASLPKMTDSDRLRSILEAHNATLPTPYSLGGNADEIGQFYTLLPVEFQRIGEGQKATATAMKACIKEYNATLPTQLKTSGSREALLEQLAIIDPEFVKLELAIPSPLPVSGSKEDMASRIKTVLPDAVFADELIEQWRSTEDNRVLVTQQQMQEAKAIQHALFNHPSSGPMLQHPQRTVEASYFGYDEDTGMEIRVRPDLEIDIDGVRIGFDLKTISMWNVKQSAVRARLHREIIDRDYHLSAAMYSDVAAFDQFFWIFVNKDEGYNWVAIVEASPDLLELGRLEYKKALRDIKQAYDTDIWPAPITEEIVDDLNDFDQRRLEALRVA